MVTDSCVKVLQCGAAREGLHPPPSGIYWIPMLCKEPCYALGGYRMTETLAVLENENGTCEVEEDK